MATTTPRSLGALIPRIALLATAAAIIAIGAAPTAGAGADPCDA